MCVYVCVCPCVYMRVDTRTQGTTCSMWLLLVPRFPERRAFCSESSAICVVILNQWPLLLSLTFGRHTHTHTHARTHTHIRTHTHTRTLTHAHTRSFTCKHTRVRTYTHFTAFAYCRSLISRSAKRRAFSSSSCFICVYDRVVCVCVLRDVELLSLPPSLRRSLALSLSRSLTLSLSHSLTLSPSCSLALSFSRSLALSP